MVRTNFFCFGGGVLSKFLLDNSSFSAPPPPDNYCTVPYVEVMNSKRQKEGRFGHAVYKFTFTVCLRGHCTFVVVLVTRVPSKHLHLLRPCVP